MKTLNEAIFMAVCIVAAVVCISVCIVFLADTVRKGLEFRKQTLHGKNLTLAARHLGLERFPGESDAYLRARTIAWIKRI